MTRLNPVWAYFAHFPLKEKKQALIRIQTIYLTTNIDVIHSQES